MMALLSTNLDPEEMTKATSFAVCLGGDSEDHGYFVQQDEDGGYIITGSTKPTRDVESDMLLAKINPQGDLVWKRTYGTKYEDVGRCVKRTRDGGYIVVGYAGYHYSLESDKRKRSPYVVKTDSQGKANWEKIFDKLSNDDSEGRGVIQSRDESFIIAGDSDGYPSVIKIDSKGNVLWEKALKDNDGFARSVEYANDDSCLIAGIGGPSYDDSFVALIGSEGQVMWRKIYKGSKTLNAYSVNVYSVQKTADNGFILGGETSAKYLKEYDLYLAKIDKDGELQWEKQYGDKGEEKGYEILQAQNTRDGGYVIVGMTSGSFEGKGRDIYLVKTDEKGDVNWTRSYDFSSNDVGACVQQTMDGGFIVIGTTFAGEMSRNNIILIKTDSEGKVENPMVKNIRIHPKKGR
jgi:hypothetical protein